MVVQCLINLFAPGLARCVPANLLYKYTTMLKTLQPLGLNVKPLCTDIQYNL